MDLYLRIPRRFQAFNHYFDAVPGFKDVGYYAQTDVIFIDGPGFDFLYTLPGMRMVRLAGSGLLRVQGAVGGLQIALAQPGFDAVRRHIE